MASTDQIRSLQETVNTYAAIAGFVPVPEDGELTQDDVAATLRALGWIGGGGSITDENDLTVDVTDNEANEAAKLVVVTDRAALARDPSNVIDFLTQVGKRLGLQTAQGSSVGSVIADLEGQARRIIDDAVSFVRGQPATPTSSGQTTMTAQPGLPLWVKVLGFAGAVAVGAFVVHRLTAHHTE